MSIKLSIKKMKSLLAVHEKKKNMRWAHDICTASRFVHIDVWRFCPPRDDVRTVVIPTLEDARDRLLDLVGKEGYNNKKLTQYAANDLERIKNLKDNYLNGRSSAFRPGDKRSEPESQAG